MRNLKSRLCMYKLGLSAQTWTLLFALHSFYGVFTSLRHYNLTVVVVVVMAVVVVVVVVVAEVTVVVR